MKTILRATVWCTAMLLATAHGAPAPAPADSAASAAPKETWALATGKNADGSRTIIYRFIDDLGPRAGDRATQRERVTLRWSYDVDANNGMPTDEDKAAMDELEDLLDPEFDGDGFANLALVTTGNGERVWTWYTRSSSDFRIRLARTLRGHGPYPVQVEEAADPGWTAWTQLRADVRR